jgi:hypothetical protein
MDRMDGKDRMDGTDGEKLLVLPVLALLALGCGEEEMCTQLGVDGCYAEVGCNGAQTCPLDAAGMNALRDYLGGLDCDQDWYHAYCDGAPYPPDAGCPGVRRVRGGK